MKRLYVGNIAFKASEEDLRNCFAQYGFSADSVQIIRDRHTGQSRGYGFVEMGDDEEAVRAMLILNGKEFLGRALVVSEAHPPRNGGRRWDGLGYTGQLKTVA